MTYQNCFAYQLFHYRCSQEHFFLSETLKSSKIAFCCFTSNRSSSKKLFLYQGSIKSFSPEPAAGSISSAHSSSGICSPDRFVQASFWLAEINKSSPHASSRDSGVSAGSFPVEPKPAAAPLPQSSLDFFSPSSQISLVPSHREPGVGYPSPLLSSLDRSNKARGLQKRGVLLR